MLVHLLTNYYPSIHVIIINCVMFMLQKGIQPSGLATLMLSDLWSAHITTDNKIYYVNTENKGMSQYSLISVSLGQILF